MGCKPRGRWRDPPVRTYRGHDVRLLTGGFLLFRCKLNGEVAVQPREIPFDRPWLYRKQEEALFNDSRYAAVEASTKSGKTVACLVWLAEQAFHGKEARNYWWIAPIFPQAKIAYRRMKRAIPKELYESNEGELTITLVNGTVIWFKGSTDPDALYGEDVYAAVVDEASRVKEESWFALRSTLTATRGPVRIIGNVKGRKNWAYKVARRAEAGERGWHYAKITAQDAVDAGVLDQEEIEDARRNLPELVFRELYEAEAADDVNNPFGSEYIRECVAPLSTMPARSWGWDLAKSVDWTVGIGLDQNRYVSTFRRFQLPWEETFDRITGATGRQPALVDSTGVGDPIMERLTRRGHGRYESQKFTAQSKQQLMEGLAVAIQNREVHFPEGPIVDELLSFEYEYTSKGGVIYRSSDGMHDDCVMALALAVKQSHSRPVFTGGGIQMPGAV
jgi:hypothetical protein